jgi:hypothetical protein
MKGMVVMNLPTRFSDLETDEVMVQQPSRRVILALVAVAVGMLVLASLSSGRITASAQRRAEPARAIAVDAATGATLDFRQLVDIF